MSLKKKAELILFPVAFAAGIVTGVVAVRTKKKAAQIAAVEGALNEELPAEEDVSAKKSVEELAAEEDVSAEKSVEELAAEEDVSAEESAAEPETE